MSQSNYMTLRQYLILMTAGTTAALVSWISVLMLVNPRSAGFLGVGIFIATLFLAITGVSSIGGLFIRTAVLRRDELIARAVGNSFRQGIFLAAFISGVLLMKSTGSLTPWTLILFIGALTLLEFFFIAFRRR